MRFKRDMFWSTFLNITVVNDAQILRYRCMYNRSVCGLGLGGVLFFGGFFFIALSRKYTWDYKKLKYNCYK